MDFAHYWFQAPAGGPDPALIGNSLRFTPAKSTGLTRTQTTDHESSDFTLSFWMKKAYVGDDNMMLLHLEAGSAYSYITFGETSGDADSLIARGQSSGYAFNTDRRYRDSSAWFHVVLSVEVGTITKGWINGVLDKDTGAASGWRFNGAYPLGMGRTVSGSNYLNGYLAEWHFVDGQALDPTSFGEFNADGVWTPKKVTGVTYGGNGYFLDFSDPADIGADRSGNGNNWTPTGFELTDTTSHLYDSMADSPTNNYGTWNPVAKGPSGTQPPDRLLNGNIQHQYKRDAGDFYATGTIGLVGTENYYWEVKVLVASGFFCLIGICEQDWTWNNSSTVRYLSGDGKISNSPDDPQGNPNYTGATYGKDDVIGCAWNGGNQTIQFYKNGIAQGSPVSPKVTTGKTFVPSWNAAYNDWEVVLNCGQLPFAHTPPTGYKPLSTADLPAPSLPATITGTFAGNGNAFGPFVYTGCVPGRIQYGSVDVLYQNRHSQSDVDFLSNGFKVRSGTSNSGTVSYTVTTTHSGGEYNGKQVPFGGTGVSPAPAVSN